MPDTTEININLPTQPRSFAVNLPNSRLRRLDFSALDYETSRQIIIEYIKTYYPNDFNDFVASNGLMILIDILAGLTDKLSLRSDLLANESFLQTAVTQEAVENHLQLIGQRILGPDGSNIIYEVYKGPGDWKSDIIIPAGKRGVVAWGVQGEFAPEFTDFSTGEINQIIRLIDDDVLLDPITVEVVFGGVTTNWDVVYEPIQRYGPRDQVVEVQFYDDTAGNPSSVFLFGDNFNGKVPESGSEIIIRYRVGGGSIGRIAAGAINQSLPIRNNGRQISINFRNISSSTGGVDIETIEEAKRRAPKTFSLHGFVGTASDYINFASGFSHPYYGKIGKAAIVLETSPNDNIVDVYVLAEGQDNLPTSASVQLKEALQTALSNLNVVTDQVRIKDGIIKPINLRLTIVLDRNADARIVQININNAVDEFFSFANFDMGQPLYLSKLIEAVEAVDGVRYVDLISPNQNILASGELAQNNPFLVGVNEIITLGTSQIDFYYDNIDQSNRIS